MRMLRQHFEWHTHLHKDNPTFGRKKKTSEIAFLLSARRTFTKVVSLSLAYGLVTARISQLRMAQL